MDSNEFKVFLFVANHLLLDVDGHGLISCHDSEPFSVDLLVNPCEDIQGKTAFASLTGQTICLHFCWLKVMDDGLDFDVDMFFAGLSFDWDLYYFGLVTG